jgi:hypothetical protein
MPPQPAESPYTESQLLLYHDIQNPVWAPHRHLQQDKLHWERGIGQRRAPAEGAGRNIVGSMLKRRDRRPGALWTLVPL